MSDLCCASCEGGNPRFLTRWIWLPSSHDLVAILDSLSDLTLETDTVLVPLNVIMILFSSIIHSLHLLIQHRRPKERGNFCVSSLFFPFFAFPSPPLFVLLYLVYLPALSSTEISQIPKQFENSLIFYEEIEEEDDDDQVHPDSFEFDLPLNLPPTCLFFTFFRASSS